MNDDLDEKLIEVDDEESGEAGELHTFAAESACDRLDVFLAERCSDLTRSAVQNLIRQGHARVNGALAKANRRIKAGEIVELTVPSVRTAELRSEDLPLDIVYEDGDIAVVNKAQGMVVHPAAGNESGTLVNALLFHLTDLAGIGGEMRPGIVHRIDKDTSGLLVVAKNDAAHRHLAAQIAQKTAGRVYLAIVEGCPKAEAGAVNAPIGRHKTDRKKMAVVADGRSAVTHYRVLERYNGFSLLELKLETGRTHQIRVHMAYIGHPVAGDPVYGPNKPKLGLSAQALHAWQLHLVHPRTGEAMTFCAPPHRVVPALPQKAAQRKADTRMTGRCVFTDTV